MRFSGALKIPAGLALAALVAACGGKGEYAADDPVGPRSGPVGRYDPNDDSLFGDGGFTFGRLASGELFEDEAEVNGNGAPVNKYLWQASLDTVSFMPLASTDPFTGVIATDWSSTEAAPGERFKVTVYLTSAALSASSVNVAVYRQIRDEAGNWVQAAVDPATPGRLEDAILTRARQIRVAELENKEAG